MIHKMVNGTAAERTDFTLAVYGDYMNGIELIVINECTDLSGVNLIK